MSENTRPGWDEYFSALARTVATRGDCTRRQVGCVIVDADHRVISTGYNGAEPGGASCLAGQCPRGRDVDAPRTEDYSNCVAIHAEANALLFARTSCKGATVYVTAQPCDGCGKLLRGAGVSRVVVVQPPEVAVLPRQTAKATLRSLIAQVDRDLEQPYWRERWAGADDAMHEFPGEVKAWLSSLIDFGWEVPDQLLDEIGDAMTQPLTDEPTVPTDRLPPPILGGGFYARQPTTWGSFPENAVPSFTIPPSAFPHVELPGAESLRKYREGTIDPNPRYQKRFEETVREAHNAAVRAQDSAYALEAETRVREAFEAALNQHNGTWDKTNAEAARLAALAIRAIRDELPPHQTLASDCRSPESQGFATSAGLTCKRCNPDV